MVVKEDPTAGRLRALGIVEVDAITPEPAVLTPKLVVVKFYFPVDGVLVSLASPRLSAPRLPRTLIEEAV